MRCRVPHGLYPLVSTAKVFIIRTASSPKGSSHQALQLGHRHFPMLKRHSDPNDECLDGLDALFLARNVSTYYEDEEQSKANLDL